MCNTCYLYGHERHMDRVPVSPWVDRGIKDGDNIYCHHDINEIIITAEKMNDFRACGKIMPPYNFQSHFTDC